MLLVLPFDCQRDVCPIKFDEFMVRSKVISETFITKLDKEICSSQYQALIILLIIEVDDKDVSIVVGLGPKINREGMMVDNRRKR